MPGPQSNHRREVKQYLAVLRESNAILLELKRHSDLFPPAGEYQGKEINDVWTTVCDYAYATGDSIAHLVKQSRHNQAAPLARALFELGVRLVWGSPSDDRWDRLHLYYELRYSRLCHQLLKNGLATEDLIEASKNPLEKSENDGLSPMPDDLGVVLNEMLESGQPSTKRNFGRQIHRQIHLYLHGAAHANPALLSGESSKMMALMTVFAVVFAVGALVDAMQKQTSLPVQPFSEIMAPLWEALDQLNAIQELAD